MKSLHRVVVAGIVLSSALLAVAPQIALSHGDDHHEEKPKAQEVTVTIDGGFHPGEVKVHPGREVRITLVRKEVHGCGDIVRFPSLKETVKGKEIVVERTIKTGETAIVTFTPKEKATLHFTCGMGMYKGTIVVK